MSLWAHDLPCPPEDPQVTLVNLKHISLVYEPSVHAHRSLETGPHNTCPYRIVFL